MINNKSILEWSKTFTKFIKKRITKIETLKIKAGKDESIFLKNIEQILY